MRNRLKGILLSITGLFVGFTSTGFANGSEFIVPLVQTETYNVNSTTMTDASFDSTTWEYSNFGKNGSNIKEIHINACLNNYYEDDPFEPIYLQMQNINYSGGVMSSENLYFTKIDCKKVVSERFKQHMLELIFDRRISSNTNYGGLRMYANAFNVYVEYVFNIEFTFKTAFEFNVQSILFRGKTGSGYLSFMTYNLLDKNDNIMTQIKNTKTVGTTMTTEQITLPKRLQEVWGITFNIPMIVGMDTDNVFYIQEFNSFSTERFYKPSFDSQGSGNLALPLPDYQACSWSDFMCHLSNFGTWLVRDFPPTQMLYTGFNYVLTFFTGLLSMFVGLFGLTINGTSIVSSKYTGIFGYVMLLGFAVGMWKLIGFVRGLLS